MTVLNTYPPNYEAICARFPIRNRLGIIFAYGDKLYNPNGSNIPRHLMAHENVHGQRQLAMGVEAWWELYLANDHFRLEEEVLAYREQWKELQKVDRAERRRWKKQIVRDLAGAMYGKLVSRERAEMLICGEVATV